MSEIVLLKNPITILKRHSCIFIVFSAVIFLHILTYLFNVLIVNNLCDKKISTLHLKLGVFSRKYQGFSWFLNVKVRGTFVQKSGINADKNLINNV